MRAQGIEATIGTHHMPMTTFFRERGGFARGDFPVTDDVWERAITLPLHTRLEPAEQELVADALLSLIAAGARARR
jgi:dTDP-4-amino-4,6-dideoxygalactose transaminase